MNTAISLLSLIVAVFAAPFAAAATNALFALDSELPDSWTMQQEVLEAATPATLWTSEDDLEDFAIDLEFRTTDAARALLHLYAAPERNRSLPIQLVPPVDPYDESVEKPKDAARCGAFYGIKPPIFFAHARPNGQWNQLRVIAAGPKVAVQLNGTWINAIDLQRFTDPETTPYGTPLIGTDGTAPAAFATQGRIGLQVPDRSDSPAFRKLTLGPISDAQRQLLDSLTAPIATANPNGLELGAGINISHWLSQRQKSHPSPAKLFTAQDVTRIADAGFDHVRLPIEESVMWDDNGKRRAKSFRMLDTALQQIHAAGLKAVVDLHIVNSHHFNAVNDGTKNTLFSDPKSQEHLIDLWRDLSAFLNKWDNSFLAYEILNEAVAEKHEDWNRLLAIVHPALRELEPERTLILGSNRWQQTRTFPYLRIPEDDANLVLSFHFYDPFYFTHYKTPWTSEVGRYQGPIHYPGLLVTDAELATVEPRSFAARLADSQGPHNRETLRHAMSYAIEYARIYGLPLYCGEYGTYKHGPRREDLLHWYRDVGSILKAEQINHAAWDYQGSFGIKDLKTGEFDQPLIDAILQGN